VRLHLQQRHRLPHHQTVGSSNLPLPPSQSAAASITICSTKRLSGA
jgi:hypothetical protein